MDLDARHEINIPGMTAVLHIVVIYRSEHTSERDRQERFFMTENIFIYFFPMIVYYVK